MNELDVKTLAFSYTHRPLSSMLQQPAEPAGRGRDAGCLARPAQIRAYYGGPAILELLKPARFNVKDRWTTSPTRKPRPTCLLEFPEPRQHTPTTLSRSRRPAPDFRRIWRAQLGGALHLGVKNR